MLFSSPGWDFIRLFAKQLRGVARPECHHIRKHIEQHVDCVADDDEANKIDYCDNGQFTRIPTIRCRLIFGVIVIMGAEKHLCAIRPQVTILVEGPPR